MADDNTLTIKLEGDGGPPGQPSPPAAPPAAPPPAGVPAPPAFASAALPTGPFVGGVPPRSAGPIEVELTRENAELLAGYLRGRLSGDEFLGKVTAAAAGAGMAATGAAAAAVSAAAAAQSAATAAQQVPPIPPAGTSGTALPGGGAGGPPQLPPRTGSVGPPPAGGGPPPVPSSAGVLVPAGGGSMVPSAGAARGGAIAAGGQNVIPAGGAGGAAAGAGGLSAAAAVGVVGAVIVAGKVMAEKIGEAGEAVRAGMQKAGDAAAGLAGNRALPAVTMASDAAAGHLEKFGLVGKVWAEELRTMTKAVTVAKQTLDAFADRGKELAELNSTIAGASARQEVALLRADMREANRLQKEYADLIDAQTRIDVATQDAIVELKKVILPVLVRVAEGVATIVETATAVMEGVAKVREEIRQQLAEGMLAAIRTAFPGRVGELLEKALKDYLKRGKEADAEIGIDQIRRAAEMDFGIPAGRNEGDVQAAQAMGAPLLG